MKNIRCPKSITLSPYSLLLLLFAASPLVGNAQLKHSSKVTKSGVENNFTITIGGNSSSPSNAGYVEYTKTKYIYSDGTMDKPSRITTASFAFEGNNIYYRDEINNKMTFVFNHNENGNAVYYHKAVSIFDGSTSINYSMALLVSADKKTINLIFNADSSDRWYTVYKKGVDRSIGEMYE